MAPKVNALKAVQDAGRLSETFARLLATENIQIVYDPNAKSPSFNTKDRLLRLPVWDGISYDVKRMLIASQVGHALHTPADELDPRLGKNKVKWERKIAERGKEYKDILHVMETARVERLVKRKYPGLRSSFYAGYKELHEDKNFFGVKGSDLNKLHLVDRMNLASKLSAVLDVKFRPDEQKFMDQLAETETFADTVAVTDAIWDYIQAQKNPPPPPPQSGGKSDSDQKQDGKSNQPKPKDEKPKEKDEKPKDKEKDKDEKSSKDKGEKDKKPKEEKEESEEPDDGTDQDDSDSDGDESDDSDGDEDSDTEGDNAEGDEGGNDGGGGAEGNDKSGKKPGKASPGGEGDAGEAGEGMGEGSGGLKTTKAFSGDLSGEDETDHVGMEFTKDSPNQDKSDGSGSDDEKGKVNTLDQMPVGGYGPNESVFVPMRTDQSFYDALQKYAAQNYNQNYIYGSIPDDMSAASKYIVPYKDVYKKVKTSSNSNVEHAKTIWQKFRNDNLGTIGFMTMEFEMRKKAKLAKKSLVSKTGEIDMARLPMYRYQEDIFKRITIVPKGKNHGVMFFIDWSSSMTGYLNKTIHQMLNLILFCRRLKIPFEVFAFSDGASGHPIKGGGITATGDNLSISYGGYGGEVRLLNFMSSRMTTAEFEYAAQYLMMVGAAYDRVPGFTSSGPFSLNGTPLNQAIMLSSEIVREFHEVMRVDIMNVIWLTDGASNGILTAKGDHPNVLRDKKTGIVFANQNAHGSSPSNGDPTAITGQLLAVSKLRTGANIIGFFLTDGRTVSDFVKMTKEWGLEPKHLQKSGIMTVENYKGHDLYVVIDQSKMILDTSSRADPMVKKETRVMLTNLISMIS